MKILYLPSCWSQQRQFSKKRWIYPVHLAMEAEYHRQNGHDVVWDGIDDGSFDIVAREPSFEDFTLLPAPDRIFTHAFDKKYQNNGNFKYHPGTYIQVANGCWWGKCEFCVEKNNTWRVRPVEQVIQELEEINRLGFKEVFDDSGTFPTGDWLDSFIRSLNFNKFGFRLGCNMRAVDVDYRSMRMAGFRMLLFGVESANQNTLEKINKGTKTTDIQYLKKASEVGIECHGAFMFGYPRETEEDSLRTLNLAHYLLRKGILKTAQASFYMPPDGKNNPSQRKYVNKLYDVKWNPEFLFNQLKDIKDWNDVKYLWKKISSSIRR